MLPGLGTLSNSGSMPISAGGGAAGPSTAKGHNSIGGAGTGAVNFGQSSWKSFAAVGVIGVCGLMIWLGSKK